VCCRRRPEYPAQLDIEEGQHSCQGLAIGIWCDATTFAFPAAEDYVPVSYGEKLKCYTGEQTRRRDVLSLRVLAVAIICIGYGRIAGQ
jgi:hypothetical protein